MIAASKVHDLHAKIHDILESAVSKQVSTTAYTLAYLDSASRQHYQVFPFSMMLRILFFPIRLALMDS